MAAGATASRAVLYGTVAAGGLAAEAYAAIRLCRALAILDGRELLYGIGLGLAGMAAIILAFERLPSRSYSTLQSAPLLTERLPSGRRRLVRDLVIELDGRTLRVPKCTETGRRAGRDLRVRPIT